MFKKQSDWFEIAKDSSLKSTKRIKAINKISEHTLLLELAKFLSENEDIHSNWAQNALYPVLPKITLEEILQYNLGLFISPIMVEKISRQDLLCWLAEHGDFNSSKMYEGEYKNVRELALLRVNDPQKKALLEEKIQAKKDEIVCLDEALAKEAAAKREVWKEKRLCPSCGGNCKYEIITRQIDSTVTGFMAYESKNLEPIEQGVCQKCGHKFTSMSPKEAQEHWSSKNE